MPTSPLALAVKGIETNVPKSSVVSENFPSATNPSLKPKLFPRLSAASATYRSGHESERLVEPA